MVKNFYIFLKIISKIHEYSLKFVWVCLFMNWSSLLCGVLIISLLLFRLVFLYYIFNTCVHSSPHPNVDPQSYTPGPGPQQIVWMFVPIDYKPYKRLLRKTPPGQASVSVDERNKQVSSYIVGWNLAFNYMRKHMFRFGASSHIGHCYSQAYQVPYVFVSNKSQKFSHKP